MVKTSGHLAVSHGLAPFFRHRVVSSPGCAFRLFGQAQAGPLLLRRLPAKQTLDLSVALPSGGPRAPLWAVATAPP